MKLGIMWLYWIHHKTHEMTSTQEPRRSGRIVRPSIRFIRPGETYETISKEAETDPYTYEDAMNDIDAYYWVKAINLNQILCIPIKFGIL